MAMTPRLRLVPAADHKAQSGLKMKRIVLFGSQITTGGAQRVLLDQAQWFWEQGYDVQAVFFYDKDGLLPQWSARYPFPITALSFYHRGAGLGKNLSGLIHGFFRLIRLLKQVKPDYFESFTHDANLMGIPAACLCGVKKRIGTHHGQFAGQSSRSRRLHTLVINSGMTSKLVCVSERAKRQALEEGIHEQKIEVIFNGVKPVDTDPVIRAETRQSLRLKTNDVMILNVGRLTPEKAQQHLASAAALLADHPEYRFFIAGEGPCRAALEKQISESGLKESFRLLGNRSDVDHLLNAADLFVLYSDTEGMPVSLMEAMSAGLPCIASDLEGIVQLMPEAQYGTLIPAGDPQLLAETIRKVLYDPQLCIEQGKAASHRIRSQFSIGASCQNYEALFNA